MSFPAVCPHDPIEEIAADLFMVRGSVPLNALLTITRNMAIVRHDGELTLVNSVRLSPSEEARLRELGSVRRIIRLGPFHGRDDAYYRETFGAELWTPGDSSAYPDSKPDRIFDEATEAPFPDAGFFCFRGTKQPEGALWLRGGSGVLLACDAIQHYGDYRHCNLPARLLMPWIGFPRTTILGPFWLKLMTPEGASLENEFGRLLSTCSFETLLSAHGSLLRGGAHGAVAAATARAYRK